jgi:hypothetical protein
MIQDPDMMDPSPSAWFKQATVQTFAQHAPNLDDGIIVLLSGKHLADISRAEQRGQPWVEQATRLGGF